MFIKLNRRQSGFTLIELLIVIAILGILAVLAAPKFMNLQTQSQASACLANQRALETALEQYSSQNTAGSYAYPTDYATQTSLTGGGFIKRAITCPGGGSLTWTTGGVVTCSISTHNSPST